MADETAEIIPFPVRKKPIASIRQAVGQLRSHELLLAAGTLMNLVEEAHEVGDSANFCELVKTLHVILERLLVEEGWV